MRREDSCLNCGETREIAAHGLCFACYRKNDRAKSADRHSPGVSKERKRLFRGFSSVMAGLSELGASKETMLLIRQELEPYIGPISVFLQSQNSTLVNGEHVSGNSVHIEARR